MSEEAKKELNKYLDNFNKELAKADKIPLVIITQERVEEAYKRKEQLDKQL